tara:strand:+ start:1641 stop:2225 length:585 start_codon:yes stop_codon:yes gene_type:complete
MAASSESSDLQLLDRVATRLAMAEDHQLEDLLRSLLCPILAKIPSGAAARTKVLEVLSHINKRVRGSSSIKLPVKELLHMFQLDANNPPAVLTLALMYVDMGFGRLSLEEREALIPSLLIDIGKRPAPQQERMLENFVEVLEALAKEKRTSIMGEHDVGGECTLSAGDTRAILSYLLDTLLWLGPSGMLLYVVF